MPVVFLHVRFSLFCQNSILNFFPCSNSAPSAYGVLALTLPRYGESVCHFKALETRAPLDQFKTLGSIPNFTMSLGI